MKEEDQLKFILKANLAEEPPADFTDSVMQKIVASKAVAKPKAESTVLPWLAGLFLLAVGVLFFLSQHMQTDSIGVQVPAFLSWNMFRQVVYLLAVFWLIFPISLLFNQPRKEVLLRD